MSEMAKRERRRFTKEQKESAVAAYRACENYSQVGREIGVHPSVLRAWVKQADADEGKGPAVALTTDERAELSKLRRDLRRVEQERDFLKKAAAYFAKDEDRRTR
jgi:transposase-like protein